MKAELARITRSIIKINFNGDNLTATSLVANHDQINGCGSQVFANCELRPLDYQLTLDGYTIFLVAIGNIRI